MSKDGKVGGGSENSFRHFQVHEKKEGGSNISYAITEIEMNPKIKMKIYFTSIKGRRESNEDRHNIILNINQLNNEQNNINLLAIYDGHGGSFVSTYLKDKLPLYYCHPELKTPFSKEYHYEIFKHLQKKILDYSEGQSSGSTCLLNIIYKYQDSVHMNIVNLGDSRLTIVYKNGTSKQVTLDHKTDDPEERIRIEKIG
jgi:serine/threonine protein phosphatase PrpC